MSDVYVTVLAKPGSKSSSVTWDGTRAIVRVREPAYEGRANEACGKALAAALRVPPSSVALARGGSAKVKVFALSGLSRAELETRLASLRESGTSRSS